MADSARHEVMADLQNGHRLFEMPMPEVEAMKSREIVVLVPVVKLG